MCPTVCSIVLVFGQAVRQLAHIQHRERLAVGISVNPFCEVAELPVCQLHKRMRNSLDSGDVQQPPLRNQSVKDRKHHFLLIFLVCQRHWRAYR